MKGPRHPLPAPPPRTTSTRAQNIRLGASSRYRRVLARHRRDFPPAVDPAQLDLPACHETEEQDDGGVFTPERALRLYPAAEFFVEPLDDVCGAQGLPLHFREQEEGEQFVAALAQARHHARTALGPRALEGRIRDARGVGARRVDDAVKAAADLGQRLCFGAFRSRLRSLCTQQRCTAARGHTSPTARRSPALPSMMASTGARKAARN